MRVEQACREAGSTEVAAGARRGASARSYGGCAARSPLSLKMVAPLKFNHDVVVPKGRIPELFALVDRTAPEIPAEDSAASAMPATGTFTSTSWWTRRMRQKSPARTRPSTCSSAGVVALEGSISGEHGIGFSKAPFVPLELSADEIALMKRVKQAFDPERDSQSGKDLSDVENHMSIRRNPRPGSIRGRGWVILLYAPTLRAIDSHPPGILFLACSQPAAQSQQQKSRRCARRSRS